MFINLFRKKINPPKYPILKKLYYTNFGKVNEVIIVGVIRYEHGYVYVKSNTDKLYFDNDYIRMLDHAYEEEIGKNYFTSKEEAINDYNNNLELQKIKTGKN